MASVGEMLDIMNAIAPPELAESWDNPGLLIGAAENFADKILLCVDAVPGVIEEARELGAQLIIAHHPLMFRAIKRIRDDDAEGHILCEIIRANLNLIAAHTNLDMAAGGVNDALADALGLENLTAPVPLLRVGYMRGTLGEIAAEIERRLDTRALYYGPADARIEKAALCSGAGGDEIDAAAQCGAQLFITGEMKHSELIRARQLGLCVICAGHFETERVVLSHLSNGLQTRINELQYKATIFISRTHPLA